jgi:ABC-type uncharacterized transport system auxiliary subunit
MSEIMRPSPASKLDVSRLIAAAFALAMLAACGGGSTQQEAYYRLAPPGDVGVRAGGPLKGTVEVPHFRADGVLNDRAILYRQGANTLSGYSYHFWWMAPTVLLQQSLVDTLRKAKAFDTVTTPELRLNRTYEIVGHIRRLERGPSAVTVEVELLLRNPRTGAPLLFKTYTQDASVAADADVASVVSAFSTAVDTAWANFIADLGNVQAPPQT